MVAPVGVVPWLEDDLLVVVRQDLLSLSPRSSHFGLAEKTDGILYTARQTALGAKRVLLSSVDKSVTKYLIQCRHITTGGTRRL